MFDDPKEELRRLHNELLAEEEEDWQDDDLMDVKALLGDDCEEYYEEDYEAEYPQQSHYRNYANGYGQEQDEDEEYEGVLYKDDYLEMRRRPREKGIRGLLILICLELLAILGIIGWWILWLW